MVNRIGWGEYLMHLRVHEKHHQPYDRITVVYTGKWLLNFRFKKGNSG